MNETQKQINALEKRMNDLQMEMARSDAHAAKCSKLGLSFAETYPEDLASYRAANEAYNAAETRLAELKAQRAQEEAQGDYFE